MAIKPEKGKKAAGKTDSASNHKPAKKPATKAKKPGEEDEDGGLMEEEDVKPAKKLGKDAAISSKKNEDDDEEDDVDEGPDDWEKPEEEEEWDPDFEEFDIPQSKGKKGVTGKKSGAYEEEDFKVDDEFKDLFNDKEFDDDEEDDY
jgi:hypothetical protein